MYTSMKRINITESMKHIDIFKTNKLYKDSSTFTVIFSVLNKYLKRLILLILKLIFKFNGRIVILSRTYSIAQQ